MKKKLLKSFLFYLLLSLPLMAVSSQEKNHFLVLSDMHLDVSSSYPMEISPRQQNAENDLDQQTFEKLIADIHTHIHNHVIETPEFIILLGDIVGHNRATPDAVLKNESSIFRVINQHFPRTPIFYVFGNNDAMTANYGPFKDVQWSAYTSPYDVAMASGWRNGFLSTGTVCGKKQYPCLITEEPSQGYYAAYLKPKFRLLALNTVQFSPKRNKVSAQEAAAQLAWLASQLKSATENQESVVIAMHIPLGNNIYDHSAFWLPQEQAEFLKLMATYRQTIVGLLASHTHAEEIKIIQTADKQIIAPLYFVPGLSTSHGNEPAFKAFAMTKQKEKWSVTDYQTFHFSQHTMDLPIVLNPLYRFRDYYCPTDRVTLFTCLNNVTAEKMKVFLSAGNAYYAGEMGSPEDIAITVD